MTILTRRARLCALFTLCFSLLAHGYRYLSMSFSGDAMLLTQAGEELYQVSLGRFLQPVYWQVRGYIAAPLTVGLFATAFLMLSAMIVMHLLNIRRPLHIALLCGVMATNETLAVSSASYLPWLDVYMLAMLLALLGVYIACRLRFGWLLSPLFFCLTLGLYQSYLPVASTLFILVLIRRTLCGERARDIWLSGIRACASLVLGLLLYAAVLQAMLALTGTAASQDYNGVGRVGLVALSEVLPLLAQTYVTPFVFLFGLSSAPVMPWHVSLVPPALHRALLAAFLVLGALRLSRRPRLPLSSLLTLLFLLLVLPLGMNFIQFVSQGIASGLTIYAYFLAAALPVLLMETSDAGRLPHRVVQRASALLLAMLLGVNIVGSNQMAFKRDLELSSTLSAVTRLIDQAEQTEGYIPGETPVVLLGMLPSSSVSMVRPGFESVSAHQGMRYTYAAAYETSTYWYLRMALGEPILLVSHEERVALTQSTPTEDMPAFPAQGCCRMIDGRLFIKIN